MFHSLCVYSIGDIHIFDIRAVQVSAANTTQSIVLSLKLQVQYLLNTNTRTDVRSYRIHHLSHLVCMHVSFTLCLQHWRHTHIRHSRFPRNGGEHHTEHCSVFEDVDSISVEHKHTHRMNVSFFEAPLASFGLYAYLFHFVCAALATYSYSTFAPSTRRRRTPRNASAYRWTRDGNRGRWPRTRATTRSGSSSRDVACTACSISTRLFPYFDGHRRGT